MLELRCFNVKFSPNLGDGLLSECLERALIELGAAPGTTSIDLAARQEYGDTMIGRGIIMGLLHSLPQALRQVAVRLPLALQARRRWRPHYATALARVDGVVIGGGNLLSDLDLNFPTKLRLAIAEASRRDLQVAIYACGMTGGWSKTGLKWCRKSFASTAVRSVFVRDNSSKRLWDELMGPYTGHFAQIVRDPGLLASRYFPARQRTPRTRPVVGLNLMSHVAIRYHSANTPSLTRLSDWYVEIARALISRGFQIRVFTNGSPEDVTYAQQLHPRLNSLGNEEDIAFLTQQNPEQLCAHIADLDALVAFRMHAIIAAYSYGVPAVALKWDPKLTSFMESVGRDHWLIDVTEADPNRCMELVIEGIERGLPKKEVEAVLAEAFADVGKLWSVFSSETGDR